MLNQSILNELEQMSQASDDAITLPRALMLSSMYAYDDVDVTASLEELDDIAQGISTSMSRCESLDEQLATLTYYLSEECGFQGNREDFYNPKNSHLQEVLRSKRGIPISLSVIYIEVAKANGLQLHAVGFPFHFLLGVEGNDDCFIDPFVGGRLLTREDCVGLFESYGQARDAFQDAFLLPISQRDVMVRSMRNLKCAHLRLNEVMAAISCIDMILLWDDSRHEEFRDRGLLWADRRCWQLAVKDFSTYLERCPEAEDRSKIEHALKTAKAYQHTRFD